MQIIPLNKMQATLANGSLSIDTYTSYSNPVGLAISLKEKNAHLIKEEQEVSSSTRLSFEEILRLKNTIREKKKQTKEEEDALTALLEQGGSHSVQSLLEQMVDGVRGIQNLTPEEYISLQNFLQDIGFSVDEIESLTQQMTSESGILASIERILIQSKESAGSDATGIENIIPLLRKIATGQYGASSAEEISGEQLISGLEGLLQDIKDIANQREGNIENLSAQLREEIEEIIRRREEKAQSNANASAQANTAVLAEEMKHTTSATDGVFSEFVEGSEQAEESEFSSLQDSEYEYGESNYNNGQSDNYHENSTALFGTNINIHGQPNSLVRNSTGFNILESHKSYILDTVQQTFISLQKNNSAEIVLQLNPQQLGNIELQLQYHDGRMQAILRPDQQDVYQLLREQSSYIVRSLQEQGINIDAITVVENTSGWLQYQSSRENFSQSSQENVEERAFSQEQERQGRIRNILSQITKTELHTVQQRTRLLEVIA